MIWTLTPNPALDITYHLPHLTLGEVCRARTVTERPGGKGLNVARVLDSLQVPVTATGFLGGAAGQTISRLLTELSPQVHQRWVRAGATSRRSLAAVEDDSRTTVINEPGPARSAAEWEELEALLSELGPGDTLAICGSLPPGTPAATLPRLLGNLLDAQVRVLVDTSGPNLLAAASAGAHLLKPNREELAAATGRADPLEGVRELLLRGAGVVALSLGPDGMLAAARQGRRIQVAHATPNRPVRGNPTGAGDAAVAAWTRALHERPGATPTELLDTLGEAVALSAAAVRAPVAGEIDTEEWAAQRAPRIETSSHDW